MLDQQTKKRIDDCRNILVGKITDPKSQVEQITIALIYKFMDDMDTEAIEMGGVPTYFVGEYERYSWKNIFSPRIGGDEMLSLYGEGMVKMNLNPSLPQLFRDIFKNAYLPYRDPETLKLFLKTINEFKYDHSERLGDAFEYLLSVLGSQGDAGQFRTPRHIIDFIVEIINPKKNESFMDPACGTSGFLISGFKHILKNNTNKINGDKLTPDERKKLTQNITGFDISPDMVRLSLVNLFLHGFTKPQVYEYDTLTSEDRWNEYYDVILANPPFMSPKGGIRPHKRFGIQSNRAEVLFVDYIMEHLTPKGRAGIVVPEGIIFQSGTAYKSLRKSLVEKYLVGVISLPSGVFQPYSGVKTSILILDKELSQKTDKIFFGKVDNDGFDLGAQRREIEKNDLPIISIEVSQYLEGLRNGKVIKSNKLTYVPKEQILESGDIGLSYDRYESKIIKTSSFPIVKLKEVVEVISGQSPESNFYNSNGVGLPFYQGRTDFGLMYLNKTENYTEKVTKTSIFGDVVMSVRAPVGPVNLVPFEICIGRGLCALRPSDKIDRLYLFYFLKGNQERIKGNSGAIFDNINKNQIEDLLIPLPPIEVQEEIVKELEQYQKIIDGAKQVVDNYKPVIDIDPSWEMKELGDICQILNGRAYKQEELLNEGKYPVMRVGNFFSNRDWYYSNLELESNKYCDKGDLLYAWSASFGPRIWEGSKTIYHYHIWKLLPNESIINKLFLFLLLERDTEEIKTEGGRGIAMIHITKGGIEKRMMYVPSLEIQQSIVERIESERQIIEGNKKLIEIYTQKIQDRINKIWGE
jgi:type I restriction enzyme M protein